MTTREASQVGAFRSKFDASWKRTFLFGHQGETCTPPSAARAGWEGATGTVVDSSPCSCIQCVVGLSFCGTQFSLMVS